MLGVGEHRPGMGQERFAGGGQPDPAPVADEQALAEFGLQPADLLADGRLGDWDLGCRRRDRNRPDGEVRTV
jgi:hypothetical protein